MSKTFFEAVKGRRSIYAISKESTLSDGQLESLIKDAVTFAPTAFNSQSTRVYLLLGKNHDDFWDTVEAALRKIVPAENFASTEAKMQSFKGGYGTVLYYENEPVIASLQQQFPLYKNNFPVWSQQAQGILQYIVWAALEDAGLGASLQHYSEVVEDEIKSKLSIPDGYRLIAQMPFGKPTAPAGEKTFMPIEERVTIVK